MIKPELLMGVSSFSGAIAAVNNGANAVYFGIKGYNMRDLGTNFKLNELSKLMKYLHENNARGYLALNTIIYDEELVKVEKIIKSAKKARVDAIIASDLGVMSLVKKHEIELHVSTQASVSNFTALEQYGKLGAKRIVLARELSLIQIKKLVKKARGIGIEIEVFVHGAMCISVSGRCFLSHEIFGRSANRGECLQPCRRAFFLPEKTLGKNELSVKAFFVDGDKPDYVKKEILVQGNTILSAKDLKTIDFLDKLVATGVVSLKVEGRTKPNDYVAVVARSYSSAINAIMEKKFSNKKILEWNTELGKVYNRKFSSGFYLQKPSGKDLTDIQGSNQTKKRAQIGLVKKYYVKINVVEIKLSFDLKIGDKIIIEGKNTFIEQEIVSMQSNHKELTIAKKGDLVGVKISGRARVNDVVFKVIDNDKFSKKK
ncbi:MAG: U32 family peptidase [Candidatus ainarchaeum sp.]|nr:U32 family peptidase [Candidatus ainarchaeum sp.]